MLTKPCCLCFTGKVWRSQAISLDGLLDYEEDDREEATVELSLAAEALAEALAAGYGGSIADHLLAERCEHICRHCSCIARVTAAAHETLWLWTEPDSSTHLLCHTMARDAAHALLLRGAECALARAAVVRTCLRPCSLNTLLATSYCA